MELSNGQKHTQQHKSIDKSTKHTEWERESLFFFFFWFVFIFFLAKLGLYFSVLRAKFSGERDGDFNRVRGLRFPTKQRRFNLQIQRCRLAATIRVACDRSESYWQWLPLHGKKEAWKTSFTNALTSACSLQPVNTKVPKQRSQ
jgi:hypothetical protein